MSFKLGGDQLEMATIGLNRQEANSKYALVASLSWQSSCVSVVYSGIIQLPVMIIMSLN